MRRKNGKYSKMNDKLQPQSFLDKAVLFCLKNKLAVGLVTIFLVAWGVMVAPFDWNFKTFPRDPVPVDAIPDIGENQQIVFTQWPGRSPQDVEDQISYPLTVSMLGIPGVKTVRSFSMFGFSSVYIIFKDKVDFYWSRSRVLEKLNSLPQGELPDGVQPSLGPDATALGQVYWYTLEGYDEQGNPAGGWGLNELRTIQDWYVRYALMAADGISEVASVGGFVQEYQIDTSPNAMRAHKVSLGDIFNAVRKSNVDVGARSIEVNKVEYVIRGLGFIKSLNDLEDTVVKVVDNVPIYIKDVAKVVMGPALRRGALDKDGVEAVGGVAVVRYNDNPLAAIKNLKKKINEISPGLPAKVLIDYSKVSEEELEKYASQKGFKAFDQNGILSQSAWLKYFKSHPDEKRPSWAKVSKVTVVPFYDRTKLIYETLGTLNTALVEEIIVTIIVILIMLMHFRSSLVISMTLPMAVLICFIAMKVFGIDANIVALSGIAIAIGTIVDMGIIVSENIIKYLGKLKPGESTLHAVYNATSEVSSAILTAILTTVISFLPVFTMTGAEGKLFRPLAFTKTFTLAASVIVALALVPAMAHILFTFKINSRKMKTAVLIMLAAAAIPLGIFTFWWTGAIVFFFAMYHLFNSHIPEKLQGMAIKAMNILVAVLVTIILTHYWMPLGPGAGLLKNFIVVVIPIAALLLFFWGYRRVYTPILRWALNNKMLFLTLPVVIVILGGAIWLGFDRLMGWLPKSLKTNSVYAGMIHKFPGLGKEFMPSLDEGSFLYMPTTMPHASIGEAMDVLKKQDIAISAIPEIELAVGKIGRAETPLDPAPISMIETVINYKSEYLTDQTGNRHQYKFDDDQKDFFRDVSGKPVNAPDGKPYYVHGKFMRDKQGNLIPDEFGMPFRLWRPALSSDLNPGRKDWEGIERPDDIWNKILAAAEIPGTTSAPKLQPIAARIVMLQSGMRAPMGVKVKGPDLQTIETVGLEIEKYLKEVPGIEASTVFADRIIGKPYLEIEINRKAIARYGIQVQDVQDVIEVAIGGKKLTTTVEGRERYPVRVRYFRELRDKIESIGKILVAAPDVQQVPLSHLARIKYTRGPQAIKSEDTFLVGYVLFDKQKDYAEVDVVEAAQNYLKQKIKSGDLVLPAGVSYAFAGNYENQIRAQKTLSVVLPLALFLIFMILYFQFKSVPITTFVFSAIAVAWSGGFIMIWLYGQDWFLNFSIFGESMRDLFQIHEINLSVAIWVGFLALFGIASDDGVVITTYLEQLFEKETPATTNEIREATVKAASRRIRPCLMTSATTILALLPVLTASGRGAGIMIPMAIPSFGGMTVVLVSSIVIPVLYCLRAEYRQKSKQKDKH
ncbi:MAG: efflux RND transporter permease subunit [Lentisphaerae bacterium]|nr:efflux RND transporter permease subunit [Lentisphaerota bacterium]MCP4100720.1 efflux RND transporter permease subunit [Lentisphaerota bacterium]